MIDATYFGKRKDKLGLIGAKDVHLKESVTYNFWLLKFTRPKRKCAAHEVSRSYWNLLVFGLIL